MVTKQLENGTKLQVSVKCHIEQMSQWSYVVQSGASYIIWDQQCFQNSASIRSKGSTKIVNSNQFYQIFRGSVMKNLKHGEKDLKHWSINQ